MNKNINLLFLGAGKRVSLVEKFYIAAKDLNINLRTFSYELDNLQPIQNVSEIIIGKKWNSPDIFEHIINICKIYRIDIVFANTDPATLILANLKKDLRCAFLSSDIENVEICFSKLKFQEFCELNQLPIIPTALENQYPQFAKPEFGSSSIDTFKIDTIQDREKLIKISKNFIIQKYIQGHEYTIDCYSSPYNNKTYFSPRERLLTTNGESTITKTIIDEKLNKISISLITKLNLKGPITIQIIKDNSNNYFIIEVNPRFGGGVLASIEQGYNYPLFILQELLNIEPVLKMRDKSILMKRYFKEIYFEVDY